MSNHPERWEALSKSQQEYLQIIYDADQAEEVHQRKTHTNRPASEWRWLPYNRSYIGELPTRVRHMGHSNQQARVILAELVSLGLIETRMQQDKRGEASYLAVQITQQG